MTADDDDDAAPPVEVPLTGTLDLHTFRPRDVGSLVPEWLAACRRAGLLEVRLVHGKGSGQLAAGVRELLARSAFVRALRHDGNWGAVTVDLWDPRLDEARVRAMLQACPALLDALAAVDAHGPPGAWIGAGAIRNRVWHHLHGRPGEPEDTDVDVAWWGAGDPQEDHAWEARLSAALPRRWEVVDQRRYGATSAEDGIRRWPETATTVAARGPALELYAAWGWEDLLGMWIRPIPGFPEPAWRARLAAKQWRRRFPWVRIESASS